MPKSKKFGDSDSIDSDSSDHFLNLSIKDMENPAKTSKSNKSHRQAKPTKDVRLAVDFDSDAEENLNRIILSNSTGTKRKSFQMSCEATSGATTSDSEKHLNDSTSFIIINQTKLTKLDDIEEREIKEETISDAADFSDLNSPSPDTPEIPQPSHNGLTTPDVQSVMKSIDSLAQLMSSPTAKVPISVGTQIGGTIEELSSDSDISSTEKDDSHSDDGVTIRYFVKRPIQPLPFKKRKFTRKRPHRQCDDSTDTEAFKPAKNVPPRLQRKRLALDSGGKTTAVDLPQLEKWTGLVPKNPTTSTPVKQRNLPKLFNSPSPISKSSNCSIDSSASSRKTEATIVQNVQPAKINLPVALNASRITFSRDRSRSPIDSPINRTFPKITINRNKYQNLPKSLEDVQSSDENANGAECTVDKSPSPLCSTPSPILSDSSGEEGEFPTSLFEEICENLAEDKADTTSKILPTSLNSIKKSGKQRAESSSDVQNCAKAILSKRNFLKTTEKSIRGKSKKKYKSSDAESSTAANICPPPTCESPDWDFGFNLTIDEGPSPSPTQELTESSNEQRQKPAEIRNPPKKNLSFRDISPSSHFSIPSPKVSKSTSSGDRNYSSKSSKLRSNEEANNKTKSSKAIERLTRSNTKTDVPIFAPAFYDSLIMEEPMEDPTDDIVDEIVSQLPATGVSGTISQPETSSKTVLKIHPILDAYFDGDVTDTVDEESGVLPEFLWSEIPKPPKFHSFSGRPKLIMEETPADPLDNLKLLLDERMLETIAEETNKCAESADQTKSKTRKLLNVTKEEILQCMALHINLAKTQVAEVEDYWGADAHGQLLSIKNRLNRNRFLRISRNLSFGGEVNGRNCSNPVELIQPLVDKLASRMKHLYYPTRDLAVSETIFGEFNVADIYDDSLELVDFPKPRIFELQDANGFVYNFTFQKPNETGPDAVERLVRPLRDKGHAIYQNCPNGCSVPLAYRLAQRKTYLTGTFHPDPNQNCNFPPQIFDLRETQLKLQSEGVYVAKIGSPQRPHLALLSTEFGHADFEQNPEDIIPSEGDFRYKTALKSIFKEEFVEYRKCNPSPTAHLHLDFFFHLVDICLQNAYVISKLSGRSKKRDFREFRQQLIDEICLEQNLTLPVEQLSSHKPSRFKSTKTQKKPLKRCHLCITKGWRTKFTNFQCLSCPDQPAFCKNSKRNCFDEWHKQKPTDDESDESDDLADSD